MGLASIGNALIRTASGALAAACRCCTPKYVCEVIRTSLCGFPVYECREAASSAGGPTYNSPSCDGQCPETPLCCLEEPCGPCQVCVDGQCVPCPEGFTCVNGSCVPLPPQDSWYCCFSEDNSETYCQEGPCPEGRLASGPHANSLECDQDCQPHKCVQYDCGGADCEASATGEHPTREHCLEQCEGVDPSTTPCVVTRIGGDGECPCEYSGGPGTHSFFFSIDAAARRRVGNSVCVSYVTRGGHPINVSIWAPTLGPDCEVVNPRNSQGVSGWRGCGQQDCPNARPPGEIVGGPSGRILWLAKQQGVTEFEVQVIAPCPDTEWEIVVLCGDCHEFAEEPECPPCGDQQLAGGQGVTTRSFTMPPVAGTVTFFYNAFAVPDQFIVRMGGWVVFDSGIFSGADSFGFFKPADVTLVTVQVIGPVDTAWSYVLSCPATENPFP